jgi:hypothetical protein
MSNHEQEKPRPAYFRPGEITLQVKHNPEVTRDELTVWAQNLWTNLWENRRDASHDSEDEFPSMDVAIPSMTTGEIREGRAQSLLHTIFQPLNQTPGNDTEAAKRDTFLMVAVNILNENACFVTDGIQLEAAAPNWLFSGAPHVFTHGGPGAVPVPNLGANKHVFGKNQIDAIIKKCDRGVQKHVNVVIFDTVPPELCNSELEAPDLTNAFSIPADHLIAATLQAKLAIRCADKVDIQLPPHEEIDPDPHYVRKDDYDASSHGLFIAGIIHDFAPQANIYLVEVLNQKGVGTVSSLADGFRALREDKVFKKDQFQPETCALVVNCSLCLDCPPPDEQGQITLVHEDDSGNVVGTSILHHPELAFAPVRTALEWFYNAFKGFDAQVVAAAGNDGQVTDSQPPRATYPAAFKSVLGVGAMEKANLRAWYSNLADDPPYNGVVVLGGKGHPQKAKQGVDDNPPKKWSETDASDGILGLYVGKFPAADATTGKFDRSRAKPSTDGWGRWSGTSFASGVMSGILARAAAAGCTISLKKLGNLYQNLHADPSTDRTQYGELIIDAPQG